MASAEFQANVLLRGNIATFFMALMMYAVITAIAYAIGKRVTSPNADLGFYFIGGLFGLLIIEWWLVGFYPGSGKPGIHAAMFTNWAVVFSLPRLFTSDQTERSLQVRKKVKKTLLWYSLGAPLLVLLLPIARGGSVAILMSIYSITVSFQMVPFLCRNEKYRGILRKVLWTLVFATLVNIAVWGK